MPFWQFFGATLMGKAFVKVRPTCFDFLVTLLFQTLFGSCCMLGLGTP